jgi:hypothetical protein
VVQDAADGWWQKDDSKMDIETIQTWLPIVKDTVTILATAIAALVAISGY